MLGRYLGAPAREEVFGDSSWLYGSSTRPSGRASVDGDGYRVNGRWALLSGCELAEWIALLCVVEENGEPRTVGAGLPELRLMFVRRGDFDILDTWYAGGLRGTGSHDVVVEDKSVPRRLSVSLDEPSTLDAPIGRVPIICTAAAAYAAQCLGIGQAALDTLVELTRTKAAADPGPRLGERAEVHVMIARNGAALEAARRYLRACVAELWDTVSSGTTASIEGITAVWGAAHHAVDAARSTVDATYAAAGVTSLYTDCPLERAHRDIHAMSRHIVAQAFWLENAGRVRLGMSPNHPLYAI